MFGYTLQLGTDWDIHMDKSGNIATCKQDDAIAQNVCNAIRLFKNDAYFAPDRGLPHFSMELGTKPLISVMSQRFIATAEAVQGVKKAELQDINVNDRKITGTIVLTLNSGATYSVKV